jgi:orotidine-5'-phosphate decarboxylase
MLRDECGAGFLIVTPGIRPDASAIDDQRRVLTPAEAVNAGADILVVGRPVTRADSPAQAAQKIVEEMAGARRGAADN